MIDEANRLAAGEEDLMSGVMQPGSASMHLSLAGAWARAVLSRLDVARSATSMLAPETFDAYGAAMSVVVSFYLTIDHAREVTRRSPWMPTEPIDATALDDLRRRAERLRDFYLHVEDKATRTFPYHEAEADRRAQFEGRNAPYGWVSLGFGFEQGSAVLYAPAGRSTRRETTRLSWDEIERATIAIEAWALDLLARWPEVEREWATRSGADDRQD